MIFSTVKSMAVTLILSKRRHVHGTLARHGHIAGLPRPVGPGNAQAPAGTGPAATEDLRHQNLSGTVDGDADPDSIVADRHDVLEMVRARHQSLVSFHHTAGQR